MEAMEKEYLEKKWLANDLTPEEQKAFDELPEAAFYTEIIQEATRFKAADQIKAAPFKIIESKLDGDTNKSVRFLRTFMRVAAILVLGFSIYYFYPDHTITVTTDLAQTEHITLPDNSIVQLNEKSELSYNKKKWSNTRIVHLKGEAFFDVEKGQKFDVMTTNGSVQVLGTEFNVISSGTRIEVICYEGKVLVTRDDHIVQLSPGNGVIIDDGLKKDLAIAVSQPPWIQEKSVFSRAPIKDVFSELEQQYEIPIHTMAIDTTLLFTGAFDHDNLDNALKAITAPLNLTYEIKTNQVNIKSVHE